MLRANIRYLGKDVIAACDGQCHKAWGYDQRPRIFLKDKKKCPDDWELLADHELGFAPVDPGTYECDDGKPTEPRQRLDNKWCIRQCERVVTVPRGTVKIRLPDFDRRLRNLNAEWSGLPITK